MCKFRTSLLDGRGHREHGRPASVLKTQEDPVACKHDIEMGLFKPLLLDLLACSCSEHCPNGFHAYIFHFCPFSDMQGSVTSRAISGFAELVDAVRNTEPALGSGWSILTRVWRRFPARTSSKSTVKHHVSVRVKSQHDFIAVSRSIFYLSYSTRNVQRLDMHPFVCKVCVP